MRDQRDYGRIWGVTRTAFNSLTLSLCSFMLPPSPRAASAKPIFVSCKRSMLRAENLLVYHSIHDGEHTDLRPCHEQPNGGQTPLYPTKSVRRCNKYATPEYYLANPMDTIIGLAFTATSQHPRFRMRSVDAPLVIPR
jgi:hypothetical protein